jgi:flagellar motor protein MotB
LLTFFILFFSLEPEVKKKPVDENQHLQLSLLKSLETVMKNQAAGNGTVTSISSGDGSAPEGISQEMLEELKGRVFKKGRKIIVDFPGVSFFKSGKIPLTPNGEHILKAFTEKYSAYMGNFILSIQAFADVKKVKLNRKSRFADNLELSALRGVSTMRYLQNNGIPLNRMRVAGFGELELTAIHLAELEKDARTPASLLSLARRIVLVIEPEEKAE